MKALKWLNNNFEEFLLIVLMVAITAILVLQIVMRYIFSNSLSWAEELSRYLLVWSGFISISWTLRRGSAMKLDFLSMLLPQSVTKTLSLVTQILMLAFFIYMDYQAFLLLPRIEQTSTALQMPMTWVFVSVNIGFTLTIFRLIQLIVKTVRDFGKPADHQKGVES